MNSDMQSSAGRIIAPSVKTVLTVIVVAIMVAAGAGSAVYYVESTKTESLDIVPGETLVYERTSTAALGLNAEYRTVYQILDVSNGLVSYYYEYNDFLTTSRFTGVMTVAEFRSMFAGADKTTACGVSIDTAFGQRTVDVTVNASRFDEVFTANGLAYLFMENGYSSALVSVGVEKRFMCEKVSMTIVPDNGSAAFSIAVAKGNQVNVDYTLNIGVGSGRTLYGIALETDGELTQRVPVSITGNDFSVSGLTASSCVVSFDSNGGSGSMGKITLAAGVNYYLYRSEFIAPAGTVFAGWSETEDGSGSRWIDPNADMTYFAVWKSCVNFTYDLNGGRGYIAPGIAVVGATGTYSTISCKATLVDPPDEKMLEGWSVTLGGTVYKVGVNNSVPVKEGSVIHACWKTASTATFHANNGTGAEISGEYPYNTLITMGQYSPQKLTDYGMGDFSAPDGKRFSGWSKTADGPIVSEVVALRGEIDFYAIWV
jgi:hypothetical protein